MRSRFRGVLIALAAAAFPAGATDVTVVGLFSGKAVVTINRGEPRILAVEDMPTSGKPAELLRAAEIDAEAIYAAATEIVKTKVES